MPNIITSASFIAPTQITTGSTTQAGYQLRFAADYRRPSLPWRATTNVSGSTFIAYQIPGSTGVNAAVIDAVNVASVILQRSSDGNTWVSVSTVAVGIDTRTGRRKAYVPVSNLTFGWWRLLSNSSTTDDGAGFSVGSFSLLSSVTEWTSNPGFPLDIEHRRAVIANDDFASGAREPIAIGNRHTRITLSANRMPTNMATTIDTVLGSYGQHTPFVLYLNQGNTSQVYIVHRVGSVSWAQVSASVYELSSLVLQEVQ